MTSAAYPLAKRLPPDMNLLGVFFHRAGVPEVCRYMKEVIQRGEKAVCLNLNVYCMNLALKHPWLHRFLNQANLVFCDGDGVRWGLKIRGFSPPPKITYNKWFWQLCEFCAAEGFSLFFLGAKPGVADEAARKARTRYPKLNIAGVHHGHFKKEGRENEEVMAQINRAKPDILLVCFGMPLQEQWIQTHFSEIQAHIFLKGGAAFDYASGRLTMAPAWMIQMHLEWLFRFLQDPVRLFGRYMVGNPLFLTRVLLEKLGIWKYARNAEKESL